MLQLDGTVRPAVQPLHESLPMSGLVIGRTAQFKAKHVETVLDRRLDFRSRPVSCLGVHEIYGKRTPFVIGMPHGKERAALAMSVFMFALLSA
jgi:hypothetical protein